MDLLAGQGDIEEVSGSEEVQHVQQYLTDVISRYRPVGDVGCV